MYFPSGFALKALSMGLYAPLADLVWLRFIQYYGEHRMADAQFELMYHILDVLTTLDTRFAYAYTLGGLMLTHDAQRPDQARALLKKAMVSDPDEWRFPYMYGFVHYVFLKEYAVAQTYFRISAQKPNAPDMPRRWAAFVTYFKMGDLKASLTLWTDLYNSTENPEEKQIALYYIEKIKMELDIEFLNKKVTEFTTKMGRAPHRLRELMSHGFVESIPDEPHRAQYYVKDGKVYSTWQIKK